MTKPTEPLVDVLDSNGQPTGQAMDKSAVHAQGLWHAASNVWIYSDNGTVLVQKRSMSKAQLPGEWDISVTGHVDAGETPLQAAKREMKEELNVDVQESQFELAGVHKFLEWFEKYQRDHADFRNVFFVNLPEDTQLEFNDGEVDQVKWVTLDEFLKLESKAAFVKLPAYRELIVSELKKRIG